MWGINSRAGPIPMPQVLAGDTIHACDTIGKNKTTQALNRCSAWETEKPRQQKLGPLREGYRNKVEATFVHKRVFLKVFDLSSPPTLATVTSGSTLVSFSFFFSFFISN